MARAMFYALLLANLVFFLWARWIAVPGSAGPQAGPAPMLQLVQPARGGTAATSAGGGGKGSAAAAGRATPGGSSTSVSTSGTAAGGSG